MRLRREGPVWYPRVAVVAAAWLVVGALGGASAALAGGSGDRAGLERDFRDPPPSLRAGFVWFWPGPSVEDAEVRAEVEEMSGAGFSRAHLFEVAEIFEEPEQGWGTRRWTERMRELFRAARDNDFKIDMSPSSGYPWRSPAVTGEDAHLSVQQLVYGHRAVTGPSQFVGPVPRPDNLDEPKATLIAVTAARRHPAGTNAQGEMLLEPNSAVDLTSMVDGDGNVRWDVPAGDWVLFGFWQTPAYDVFTPGTPSTDPGGDVIDYMNPEAFEAATDYLDENLFSVLGPLARQGGGLFHETALYCYGGQLAWTGTFLDEFRTRRGYGLARLLPALTTGPDGVCYASGGVSNTIYDFAESAGERVRRDYSQTLTELWVDNHVIPMGEYAHRYGMKSAGRSWGLGQLGLNPVAVNKHYDVPEADHAHNNTIDWGRTMTSGARLSGSDEALSEFGMRWNEVHMTTLQTVKQMGDRQLSGGANLLHLHGYAYKFHKFEDRLPDWPGWWPIGDGTGLTPGGWPEAWSPEIPLWKHLPRLADYFARAQAVLQEGRPVTDVAIYRDAYGFESNIGDRLPHVGGAGDFGDAFEPVLNSSLTKAGFSFDVVDPGTVVERSTGVEDGRLVVQRPGYKALVIDPDASERIGVVDNREAMSSRVAWRLVRFADAGLPIVFVGRFPSRGVSYRDPSGEDGSLARAVARLESSPRVRLVEDAADVADALAELDVDPDLSLDGTDQSVQRCGFGAQCVYSVHRRTGKGDYWYLYNAGKETASFTGSFRAAGAPELWDLWTGERRAIGLYRVAGGRVEVPLELAHNETAVLAFERRAGRHVVSTSADEVWAGEGRLSLRSTEGGQAEARLSNGGRVSVEFGRLPDPIEPARWDLHVEGSVPEGEEVHDLELSELRDWREIPELQHSSGTGTYRSTVMLGKAWTGRGRGAYLELGRIEGGVQVRVNGKLVYPAAVPPPRLDIGPFLRQGVNRIEVEVTTTLNNRLAQISPDRNETQPYGLIGPVRLVAYAEAAVR
jgi:hypothetical protein